MLKLRDRDQGPRKKIRDLLRRHLQRAVPPRRRGSGAAASPADARPAGPAAAARSPSPRCRPPCRGRASRRPCDTICQPSSSATALATSSQCSTMFVPAVPVRRGDHLKGIGKVAVHSRPAPGAGSRSLAPPPRRTRARTSAPRNRRGPRSPPHGCRKTSRGSSARPASVSQTEARAPPPPAPRPDAADRPRPPAAPCEVSASSSTASAPFSPSCRRLPQQLQRLRQAVARRRRCA